MSEQSVFVRRLKEARKHVGLTQERLGILAGIDEESASARMNQYEKGKHVPDYQTVQRLAAVLNCPAAYFYADDDLCAEMLVRFHRLPRARQQELVEHIQPRQSGDLMTDEQ